LGDLGKAFSVSLGQAVVPRELLLCWWRGREAGQGAGQSEGTAETATGQAKVYVVPFLEAVLGAFCMSWGFPSTRELGEAPAWLPSGSCPQPGCRG